MARNRDLFHEVAAVIEADPASYDQGAWGEGDIHEETVEFADGTVKDITCGTTHCIAGWACALSRCVPSGFGWSRFSEWTTPRGERRDVVPLARDLLGITDNQAEILFYGPSRTPEELRAIGDGARITAKRAS